jgi:hypothetical protein
VTDWWNRESGGEGDNNPDSERFPALEIVVGNVWETIRSRLG